MGEASSDFKAQLFPRRSHRRHTSSGSGRKAAKGLLRDPGWNRATEIRCLLIWLDRAFLPSLYRETFTRRVRFSWNPRPGGDSGEGARERVRQYLTIPNALTALRGLGVPLFIWLALVKEADGWAILVLAIGGITDYLDGKLARAWNQTSRFGELADPAIDRLYIVATLIVLYLREALPLWVILLLIGRDIALGLATLALTRKGQPPLQVTYLGKAATFNLLYAFPFLLLALSESWAGTAAFVFGWAFTIWGIFLYLTTGLSYLRTAMCAIGKNAY